nr:MAG TPA: hypothetical protein [Caudoviricetes sp.]
MLVSRAFGKKRTANFLSYGRQQESGRLSASAYVRRISGT